MGDWVTSARPSARLWLSAVALARFSGAWLGVIAALPAVVYLWGFTVDDALIPARYATHIARGLGYRFNPHGPSTDGVTPLGWAYVLAPFAHGGPLDALRAARLLGVFAWLAGAAALGAAVARVPGGRWRYASLALVLASAPLGGWASAGLETGVVVALATFAAALPARPAFSVAGAAFAGACAWLRPEMIAYAALLGAGRARLADRPLRRVLACVLSVAPWCVAGLVRWFVWGRPAPLAVLSKPSDLAHGVAYVLPAVLFTGAPLAALAPFAFRKLALWPRMLCAAAFVHLGVVALAGGDWMALYRLVCPVLPAFVLITAYLLAEPPSARFARPRLAVALAAELALFAMRGPVSARVLTAKLALIEAARPALVGATRVATIDVGWVGAAFDADVVDLAGATDPEIASLPGGHTSKAISGAFLTGRNPDRLVFETDPPTRANAALRDRATDQGPVFTRAIETRLAADALVQRHFRLAWTSPETLPIHYVILSRISVPSATSDPGRSD